MFATTGVTTLVISSGGTTSPNLDMNTTGPAEPVTMTIIAPAALTGTITVEVSTDNSTFGTLQSPPGTDINIAAGKSIVLDEVYVRYVRLKSSGAEGADRTFQVTGRGRGGSYR